VEQNEDEQNEDDDDSDSGSEYLSFEESDEELESKEDRAAREHERQMVLEAAGLIIKQDVPPPPVRRKSKRRPPPAAPQRLSISSTKDLPPVPEREAVDHVTHLNDAFDRYESFKQAQLSTNRLSFASVDSTVPPSPTASSISVSSPKEEQRTHSSILGFLGRKTPVETEKRTLNISGPILNVPAENSTRANSPAFGSVRACFERHLRAANDRS
jgi:actin cytoskeleton-regulatory complex protein PAN1